MSIGLRNGMKKASMLLSEPQKEVISSNKRFRVLITGRRFGKTHLCMMELLRKGRDNPNGKIFLCQSYLQNVQRDYVEES
jgi:hypothetical protein